MRERDFTQLEQRFVRRCRRFERLCNALVFFDQSVDFLVLFDPRWLPLVIKLFQLLQIHLLAPKRFRDFTPPPQLLGVHHRHHLRVRKSVHDAHIHSSDSNSSARRRLPKRAAGAERPVCASVALPGFRHRLCKMRRVAVPHSRPRRNERRQARLFITRRSARRRDGTRLKHPKLPAFIKRPFYILRRAVELMKSCARLEQLR
mmetsp:Transcript_1549/g.3282  ORF Transcript_1549/g.3282 Transcript_1549/m.3282 type:complete len:203 (-) Transcript_1549:807-1415(-)